MYTYMRSGRITGMKGLKQSLISFLVLLGMIIGGLGVDPNTTIADVVHMDEVATDEQLSVDDWEGQDVSDIYGTSPETTFRFMYNGRMLEPGESILVCTAAPGYTCPDTDVEQE
ncbi:hypothetical protein MH215_21405 [Paenibacillus sp. ACRSA]|uniref:hypothetical protein n=1 Tax=Paenibacillus sp. ACRSA TaxID=2918211 RepID=UPI001EF47698|nr:hypothetical protein [Paenibacillus sp. ACRSA]MCG7379560.1 hypothetical protein [Paenibacillus sp. ACRSA]